MELGIRGGKVVWVKDNGEVSDREVSEKAAVVFCGFPQPSGVQGGECVSMEVVAGDPIKDDIIMVWAKGHAWKRKFLLRKTTGEYVVLRKADDAIARQLLESPPPPGTPLRDCIEERRQAGRKAVSIEDLAERRGLKVWASDFFGGYWSPDCGEFNGLPAGWCLLPRGDTSLTRRVRKGPYWVLMKKAKRYSVELGTLAPEQNIEEAFEELGGREAAAARMEDKEKTQRRREERMTEMLGDSIRTLFPEMPDEDVEEVLGISRRGGAVGSAQWLYFSNLEEMRAAYDHAAALAVRAHVRHRYTDYDERLDRSPDDKETRVEARRAAAPAIDEKLREWGAGDVR